MENLITVIEDNKELLKEVSQSIEKQLERIRTDEASQKNTALYFSILIETQDLVSGLMSLLETYEEFCASTKRVIS